MWKWLFSQPLPLLLPLTKNEETTVVYEICHLLQSKSVNKDRKMKKTIERRKSKSKETKESKDKVISTSHRFICPHKHNDSS